WARLGGEGPHTVASILQERPDEAAARILECGLEVFEEVRKFAVADARKPVVAEIRHDTVPRSSETTGEIIESHNSAGPMMRAASSRSAAELRAMWSAKVSWPFRPLLPLLGLPLRRALDTSSTGTLANAAACLSVSG